MSSLQQHVNTPSHPFQLLHTSTSVCTGEHWSISHHPGGNKVYSNPLRSSQLPPLLTGDNAPWENFSPVVKRILGPRIYRDNPQKHSPFCRGFSELLPNPSVVHSSLGLWLCCTRGPTTLQEKTSERDEAPHLDLFIYLLNFFYEGERQHSTAKKLIGTRMLLNVFVLNSWIIY